MMNLYTDALVSMRCTACDYSCKSRGQKCKQKGRERRRINPNQRRDRKKEREREIEKVYLLSPDYILRCREKERERIKHASCDAAW